jgi:PAS domain S-box-containing protein
MTPSKIFSVAPSLIGLLLVLAGLFSITAPLAFPQRFAGWITDLETAFCLTIAGAALFPPLKPGPVARLRLASGMTLLLIAGMALTAAALDWSAGLSTSLSAAGANRPDGMAPATAAGFLLCGAALATMRDPRRTRFCRYLQCALCGVLLFGALGIFNTLLERGLLGSDAGIGRTLPAQAGLVLLATGLLLRSCRISWFRRYFSGREDRQVFVLSATLAMLLILLSGLTVSAILARHYIASFHETLNAAHAANSLLFRHSLDSAAQQAKAALRDSELPALLAQRKPPRQALAGAVEKLVAPDNPAQLVSLRLQDSAGRTVAVAGEAEAGAVLRTAVGRASWLSWRNGWLLEIRVPLFDGERPVGTAKIETRLPRLQEQFDYTRKLGGSGEVLACVRDGDGMRCLPSRLAQDVVRPSQSSGYETVPMQKALDGLHGSQVGRDLRGVLVAAAYGRIPGTEIGLVQKIDVDDLSSSIGTQMWQAILLLLAASGFGALLLARLVRPIVLDAVKTREELAAVLNNVPSAILASDERGVVRSINPAAERIFGATAGQLTGRPIADLFPQLEQDAGTAGPGERPHPIATQGRRLDGRLFPAEIGIGVLAEQDRRGSIYIARDVTAMKAVRAVLEESEERFKAIAANIPGMVFRCLRQEPSAALQFSYISKGIAPLFELEPKTVYADPEILVALLAGDDRARFMHALEHSARTLEQWNWEGAVSLACGRQSWIGIRATPRRHDGEAVVWDGVIFDITASKRNEQQLQDASAMLRRLSAHTEAAREEERKRIAREVHDELGQTLTALRIQVSLMKLDSADSHPEATPKLEAMMALVDRTIQTTRHVTTSLRPPALDLGIAAALEWLVSDFSAHAGIPSSFEAPEQEIALEEGRAVTLFRIVQEALTNVARHARAGSVRVTVDQLSDRIRVEIADDGTGFDPLRSESRRTFGLSGIRERVLILCGVLEVESMPGSGTRLRVEIPARVEANSKVEGETR